jgi:hypothetical protein
VGLRRAAAKKGTPNKATLAKRARAQEGLRLAEERGVTPLDIMLSFMRGEGKYTRVTRRRSGRLFLVVDRTRLHTVGACLYAGLEVADGPAPSVPSHINYRPDSGVVYVSLQGHK